MNVKLREIISLFVFAATLVATAMINLSGDSVAVQAIGFLPLLGLAGGALSAGAGLIGLSNGPKPLNQNDLQFSSTDDIQALLAQLQNPNHGYEQFAKLAASSQPTLNSLLGLNRLTGGSNLQATVQSQGMQSRGTQQAMDSFGQFKLNSIGAQSGLLGMLQNQDQFSASAMLQDRYYRQGRRDSIFNQLIGLGGNLMGAGLFGGSQPQQSTQVGGVGNFQLPALAASGSQIMQGFQGNQGGYQQSPFGVGSNMNMQLPWMNQNSFVDWMNPRR